MSRILELSAVNYKSLAKVRVPLGPLNVLVGPNEAGKSNLLDVVRFLEDSARRDLRDAVETRGGYGRIRFRGVSQEGNRRSISVGVKALVTSYASENAPDEYNLTFWESVFRRLDSDWVRRGLVRQESFLFKRYQGRGRRIQIRGSKVEFSDISSSGHRVEQPSLDLLQGESLGLATLPRLAPDKGGEEVKKFANLFLGFRVVDPNVDAAMAPNELLAEPGIASDGSNLSAFLLYLKQSYPEAYASWLQDARILVPGLVDVEFRAVQANRETVVMDIVESGVDSPTRLSEASFGTVRALTLLAILNDPRPTAITAIEEIDHGLHPYVFDHLAVRLREASRRTQLILASHSPAFVNRLTPDEIVVCERDFETGASRIPAISTAEIAQVHRAARGDLGLGEIWYTGTLGGVPT